MDNFLHNHPQWENQLGIDEAHVIIDKRDWLEARRFMIKDPALKEKDLGRYFQGKYPEHQPGYLFVGVDLASGKDSVGYTDGNLVFDAHKQNPTMAAFLRDLCDQKFDIEDWDENAKGLNWLVKNYEVEAKDIQYKYGSTPYHHFCKVLREWEDKGNGPLETLLNHHFIITKRDESLAHGG